MNKLILVVAGIIFSASAAFAQGPSSSSGKVDSTSPASSCEAKAVDKNGKPLAGAAKNSFMKKCEASNTEVKTNCDAKAIDKNGKPLAGAAKNSFIKKCEADAGK